MSVCANPYHNAHLETTSVEDAAMQESTSLEGVTSGSSTVNPPSSDHQSDEQTHLKNDSNEEVLDFDADFVVPPLFQ